MSRDRPRAALELIGTECANYVNPGRCADDADRTLDGEYQSNRWCDQCIAAWGLGTVSSG